MDLRSGIFLSRLSPFQELNAVGIERNGPVSVSTRKAGEVGSQAV